MTKVGKLHPTIRRRKRSGYVLSASLALLLSGCSTLYFHSDADQTAMEKAVAGFQAAKTAQMQALDDQRKELTAQMQGKRTAVVVKQLALRDERLVGWINKLKNLDNQDKKNKETLKKEWNEEFERVIGLRAVELLSNRGNEKVGLEELGNLPSGKTIASDLEILRALLRGVKDDQLEVEKDKSAYLQAHGESIQWCDGASRELAPLPSSANDKPEIKAAYDGLKNSCQELRETIGKHQCWRINYCATSPIILLASGGIQVEDAVPSAVAKEYCPNDTCPDATTIIDGKKPGAIYKTAQRAAAINALLKSSTAVRKTTAERLAKLEQRFKCELKKYDQQDLSARTQEGARFLDDLLKQYYEILDKVPSKEVLEKLPACKTPTAAAPAEETEGKDDCGDVASAKFPDLQGLLCDAGIKPEDLTKAVKFADSVDPVRALLDGLRAGKADFAESMSASVLHALATRAEPAETQGDDGQAAAEASDKKNDTDVATRAAFAVVDALTPAQRLMQVYEGTLPDTASVLVEMARARYEAATATADVARLRKRGDITALELAAMINEVSLLRDAWSQVDADRTKALRRYADSWTKGRLQQDVAFYDLQNIEYEAWLDREQAAVTANYQILEPAMAQLDTYAKGGWSAEDMGTILQALGTIGIGVIGYGVN